MIKTSKSVKVIADFGEGVGAAATFNSWGALRDYLI